MRLWKATLLLVLVSVSPGLTAGGTSLSVEDIAAIKRAHQRYREVWLKGDTDGVRSLFTEDCVLLSPHGDPPRVGKKTNERILVSSQRAAQYRNKINAVNRKH